LRPAKGGSRSSHSTSSMSFRDLVSCVHRVLPGILRFLRIGYDAYQITVRTHPGADTINFHDPRNQTGIIRPPAVELTAENTDQVVVRVKDGTMLVFPAYLQHSVDASTSDEERTSISFNIMFSSFTENLTKPLWQAAAAPARAGAQSSLAKPDRHRNSGPAKAVACEQAEG
jgi:Putative 2OG-Fe(II) oxygenase